MPNVSGLSLAAAIVLLAVSSASADGLDASLSGTLQRVKPAVVGIRSIASRVLTNNLMDDAKVRKVLGLPDDVLIVQRDALVIGSGVIIDRDHGYVVTNSHVIADADDIAVTLEDGRILQAQIVGSDATTDLAVIQIEAPNLTALDWGRSSDLKVGDFVTAVGSPLGLEQTATFGIISGLGRSGLGLDEYEDYIQTDAALSPGSSGGALVNGAGQLLGVMRGAPLPDEGGQGIGFAIPAAIAAEVVKTLIANGEVRRGWLGISVSLKRTDESGGQGLVVDQLACASAAEQQGVKLGDVITALNGRAFSTAAAFKNAVSLLAPATRMVLTIRRGETPVSLAVTLSDPQVGRNSSIGGVLEQVSLSAPNSSPSRACIPAGPVLLAVPSDSLAYSVGLRTGDYLTAVDGESVYSIAQVQSLLEAHDGKILLDILRAGTAYRIETE